jgi:hypothetical protein
MTEFIPPAWLCDAVDIDEIERDWLDKPGPCGVPKQKWGELRAQMMDGDEIRAFSAPKDVWQQLAGRAGYALVRKDRPIACIITLMN